MAVAACLGARSDRLQPDRVAAGRQPGEHPVQRHPPQDLGVGEQLVGRPPAARPEPSTARIRGRCDRDPAPAQAHRPGAVAVPGRGPLGVVAALGPAHRGHVRFHDRGHHLQAGPDREGQQALAHLTGQLGQRHAHRVGHGGLARVDLLVLVVLAHGGPLPRGVLGGSPEYLPHGRAQAGDRHLKFHETRDNLLRRHDHQGPPRHHPPPDSAVDALRRPPARNRAVLAA